MNKVLIVTSILITIVGLGCAVLSSYITPAEVDRNALQYAIDAGIVGLDDYNAWYPNLAEAERLAKDVDSAHSVNQLTLQQQMQKDNLSYLIYKDITTSNFAVAQQREQMLFGEKGLASMGLTLLGFGGFTGLLGLMCKRPGDITQPEMEQALATATGKTAEELSTKQRQMIQLVKGVQEFMDTYKTTLPNVIVDLKGIFDKTQDTDTRAEVAVIKATA